MEQLERELRHLYEVDKEIINAIKIISVSDAKSILQHTLVKPITPLNLTESDIINSQKNAVSRENIEKSKAH